MESIKSRCMGSQYMFWGEDCDGAPEDVPVGMDFGVLERTLQ